MELYCDFSNYLSITSIDDEPIYKCIVTGIKRIAENGRVLGVFGHHVPGKTNKDVQAITIFNQQLKHFPRYICSFFPNLRSISVIGCEIEALSPFDFIGFEDVEKLLLNGNKITKLPGDVFQYAKNLESVSFFNNRIEHIDEMTFEDLKKLKYLNLKMNATIDLCVNEFAHVRMSMDQLKGFIKIKYGGRKIEDETKMTRKLSETLEFLENFIESSRMLFEDDFKYNGTEVVDRN
ncbi:hypothetical protein PVAND_014521 [Polypedilum vanderplanki]|uniref:Uncharacterized protein n=1 Tax=Polypedilum vanderplanki TaxID=319348 RepID=A0A9J6B9F0_POLVA|nr:hypothetical protein PVAND_014521 [Polypedilum vanderplanki]